MPLLDDSDANWLLGPIEFHERFAGRWFGKYRAVVKRNDDPRKLLRVKVRLPEVYGEVDLSPWAWPCIPGAANVDVGLIDPPTKESYVWVEFEEGDPTRPIWAGGFYEELSQGRPSDGSPIEQLRDYQANSNPIPTHAQGIPNGSDIDGGVKGHPGVPRSSFAGKYPNVRGWWTRAHFLEFDDTEAAERVQLHHKRGTHVEMLQDGSMHLVAANTLRAYGDSEEKTVINSVRHSIGGSCVTDIAGDYTLNVGGSYRVTYGASMESTYPSRVLKVEGSDTLEVGGKQTITVLGDYELAVAGAANIGSMADTNLLCGGVLTLRAANSRNTTGPGATSVEVEGLGGAARLVSADPTGVASRYGVEAFGQENPSGAPAPTPAGTGPMVRAGNLSTPPQSSGVPLVQEPVALGLQLQQLLTQLVSLLMTWMSDYAAHVHAPFATSPSATATSAVLIAQLQALQSTFLTSLPPKQHPLIASDVFFTSKS